MSKSKDGRYWPISLVTADECRHRLDRRVRETEKRLFEAQEQLICVKQERFKLDLQNHSIMETGFGDISAPIHEWEVPSSWDLKKCEAVYWRYVNTRPHDSIVLRGFQQFINEQAL